MRGFAPFADPVGDTWFLVPAEVDPPQHAPLRAMVNPLFTPKRMAVLEEKIRTYARDYVERFRARGGCEFLSEFAFEFPIKVFMELMGLPQERTAQFLAWEHKLLHEPTVRVKQLASDPGGTSYAVALRELFNLDPAAPAAVSRAEVVTGEEGDVV